MITTPFGGRHEGVDNYSLFFVLFLIEKRSIIIVLVNKINYNGLFHTLKAIA